MAKKIFFGNYKGGVGKTTTVFEIGALLAKNHGKKVLLIDLDPQCSLTKICNKKSNIKSQNLMVEETLNYDLELYGEYIRGISKLNIIEGNVISKFDIIKDSIKTVGRYDKLDYIPTVLELKNSRINDISERFSHNTIDLLAIPTMIKNIEEEKKYDYILFDCPPTSNIIIQSVFLTSDYYFIPTIGDELSTDGVADYITEIESTYLKFAYDNNIGGILLKKYFGIRPKLVGILSTMYKVRKNSDKNMNALETLDKSIQKLNIEALISGTEYALENTKYIFKESIPNLDNRSDVYNYGLPKTIDLGGVHSSYEGITKVLNEILYQGEE